MTNEEAKKIILSDFKIGTKETADALCMAVDALEKQIPKKVDTQTGRCKCGHFLLPYWEIKFCPNCGQMMDWGNDNG